MADVSVEFGAKDTGLENALKTVQEELTRLDEKVKGGELSFKELQSTMKQVAQAEKLQSQLEGMAQATGDAGNAAGTAAPKVDEIGKQTKQAGKEAEDFGEKSEGGFLKMSGAVAVGQLAAEAAMAGIKAAINLAKGAIDEFGAALDLGGRLSDLAARTGEAEGNLLLLERAFTNTGASAEQVGPVINKLQKFMEDAAAGGSTQTAAMERLGLSYEELAGKTPTQQLEILAQRISAIEDPGQRAAAAMGVFGEEGAQLIPLLTNFSGSIGTAKSQLGGMVEIMNTNAATFNEVGKKIDGIKGKFMEFAAGILDRIVPALDAITEGLSRIDAAALGQKLADAFLGGTQAMQGFQAAVDAFKVGNISDALDILWESTKLQSLQTANEVGRNLIAGFKSAGDFLAEIFDMDGALFRYMKGAFIFIGGKLQEAIGGAVLGFIESLPGVLQKMNPMIGIIASSIREGVTKAAEEANAQFGLMYHSVGELKDQFVGAGSRISENMNKNLETTGDLIGGLDERAAALKAKQDEITAAVAKTNAEKQAGIDMAPVEQGNVAALLEEEKKRLANELATAKAKGDAAEKTFAQIENEIELNNAIATGNEEEIKRVQEKQKAADIAEQIKENEESLPAIIQDIIDKTGTSAETAEDLAEQLVASKNAALKIPKPIEEAKIEMEKFNSFVEWLQGEDLGKPVKPLSQKTKEARNEIEAFGKYIGSDFDGVSYPDIAKELGIDTLGMTGSQQIDAILNHIKSELPGAKQNPVDEAAGKASAQAVKSEIESQKPNVQVTPVVDQVQLEDQIGKMQAEITNEFTGGEGGPGGSGGTGGEGGDGGDANADVTSITNILNGWTEIISAIRDKLPMQALA